MIVFDAYAVIALLRGEPAAGAVAELLEADEPVTLTPLGVAEVIDRMARLVGADPDEVALDLAELGLADPEPLTAAEALHAGVVRARRYHRTRCAVSLADCVALAVAHRHRGVLATSDPHLLDVCAAERVAYVVLPDSTGRRWSVER